jgi:hypothetical protein
MFSEMFVGQLAAEVARKVIASISESGTVPKRLFDLREASVYLGRTLRGVEHMVDRGAIQVTKIDGKRQIDRVELDKLIEKSTHYQS